MTFDAKRQKTLKNKVKNNLNLFKYHNLIINHKAIKKNSRQLKGLDDSNRQL